MFKKMIAPIVVTILIILYAIFYFGVIIALVDKFWAIILAVIPLGIAGTIIYVCIERIKEIRSGEEDDLSKY